LVLPLLTEPAIPVGHLAEGALLTCRSSVARAFARRKGLRPFPSLRSVRRSPVAGFFAVR